MNLHKIAKWSLFLMISTIGFAAFFVLCGEDTPGHQMSSSFFFWSKLVAEATLLLCYAAGKYCGRKGWLPKFKDLEEEEWED